MLEDGLYKKLGPQFVCVYYLELLLEVHSTILSTMTSDTCIVPVERIRVGGGVEKTSSCTIMGLRPLYIFNCFSVGSTLNMLNTA